jgi:hypothetical protein
MIKFILVYLFFATCMFAASCAESNEPTLPGHLIIGLFWPWFLVTVLFQRLLND